jgi:hypothetical protein
MKLYFKRRVFDGRNSLLYRLTGLCAVEIVGCSGPWMWSALRNMHPNNGPWGTIDVGPLRINWYGANAKQRAFDLGRGT